MDRTRPAAAGKSLLAPRIARRVSSSTMIRGAGILILTIAFLVGAGETSLGFGSWVLCVGSQGHVAIEAVGICCTLETAVDQAPPQQSWVSEECGSCTDYPLEIAGRTAPARGENTGAAAPAFNSGIVTDFGSPSACKSAIAELAKLNPSPKLASPAPLRC